MRSSAVGILVVTTCLILLLRREKENASVSDDEKTESLTLLETYLAIWRLFKKIYIQQLTLVALLPPIGILAINYMTHLSLIKQDVPREYLALIKISVTLITLIAPLIIRDTTRPLTWFARSYSLYLVSSIPIVVYA
ncbi:unnamed protein product [Rotaria sp. Silwood2]|nr:unnamed protein product [Rotaria sp. Silwood2]CAF3031853.1 unnamed protein product [Rotaria sp. Silwood2]CAF3284840.1 unnamed protein product [Rotaria sp. Silwood2]CAF3396435.1 unnamed protein product [Rotaria sp. Silwood2]CAF4170383.1 unnamed protein product [Rotaria sp. Silwood2]